MNELKPRTTYKDRVLKYMRDFDGITSFEAIRDLGNQRLSAYIYILKHKDGYKITKQTEYGKNRWGEKTHWDRYRLEEK
jgi:hypothetical protein